MLLKIDDAAAGRAVPPWLRLAFRPFFLAGSIFSVLAMGWWVYWWLHPLTWSPYGGPLWWHGHEMIFGFAAAIVVGFLLTAVQTWTGIVGLRGWPLAALWGVWLLARLLQAVDAGVVPAVLVIGVDLMFLPAAALVLSVPVLRVRQWRNIQFVPILLLLALLNLIGHRAVLAGDPETAGRALHTAVIVVVLLVAIVGGRVIPVFTANATGMPRPATLRWLEWCSIASLGAVALVVSAGLEQFPATALVGLLLFAAVVNCWRFSRWGFWRCGRQPLLWSLHLSYGFLPLGLLAMALHAAGLASFGVALHCFTVGVIGGMILAMIARVSLGHTGRPLQPPRLMCVAFLLIAAAALLRALLPAWSASWAVIGIGLSGACWVLAYTLFLWNYTPLLLAPRVDGRPG